MAERVLLSPDVIRQLLEYDPETGKLYLAPRDLDWFTSDARLSQEAKRNSWNARHAGREAGCPDKDGYIRLSLMYQRIPAHRAVWAIHHGEWPKGVIDHIDGNRVNNRIANLRDVTNAENLRNRHRVRSNSGVLGVSFCQRAQKYLASISVSGKPRHIGLFVDLEDAKAAREAAEAKYGYYQR